MTGITTIVIFEGLETAILKCSGSEKKYDKHPVKP